MTTMRAFQVRTDDGLELSCIERGEVRGTPMVLLHGYSDSCRSFEPLLNRLPGSIRAVAISQRGHGDSTKLAAGYRIGDFAGDVAAVMDRLTLPRAVVLGHSMGSLVAQRFALDHPDRLLGLVLVGAFRTLQGNAAMADLWREVIADLTDPVHPALVRAFQESTLATPVAPAFLETVIAESLKLPAHVWREVGRGLMAEDFSAELRCITAPTLILWGDQDGFSGRHEQIALEVSIRNSRSTIFAGIGHAPHWEAPDRAADEIAAFIMAKVAAAPR